MKIFNTPTDVGYSVEEYTPPAIYLALGPIDFDPCAASTTRIGRYANWTKEDDGLNREWPKEWFGFVNPPFDMKELVIERCNDHRGAVLLLPGGPSAEWLNGLFKKCDAWFMLSKRVKFSSNVRRNGSAKFTTNLYAFGGKAVDRIRKSGLDGILAGRI